MKSKLIAIALAFVATAGAMAQQYVLMPDSTNNRLVAFDPNDGSVINTNLFGLQAGTPISAIQVNNEVWVSEQIGDRISRWDWSGNLLGNISGGIDNVRGMSLIGNTVYLSNGGTANGAPGASVITYDMSGNNTGFFTTPNAPSPFYVLEHNGSLLVSSSSANDDVHRYSNGGTSLGTFYNGTNAFGEQMEIAANGDVLIGWFTTGIVARHDPATGAVISSFTASGARGVHQLGNGNILWSSGAGAFVYDVNAGTSTQVYTGGGRFFSTAAVPEPASMLALGAGVLALARRRRK